MFDLLLLLSEGRLLYYGPASDAVRSFPHPSVSSRAPNYDPPGLMCAQARFCPYHLRTLPSLSLPRTIRLSGTPRET